MAKKPTIKVIERKLGQFKADGFYNPNNNEIEKPPTPQKNILQELIKN